MSKADRQARARQGRQVQAGDGRYIGIRAATATATELAYLGVRAATTTEFSLASLILA